MAGQPGGTTPDRPGGHPMPGHAWHLGTAGGPERAEHGAMARYRRPPEPAQFSRLLAHCGRTGSVSSSSPAQLSPPAGPGFAFTPAAWGAPRCRTRSVTRLTRHGGIPVCIVRFRERRGSQGCSCTPGWPGQATGGRQLRAGGDRLPDGPGRLCRGPPAHRGRDRDRAAGVRPRHGGRRGAQRSGGNGRNVRRDAGGFAAAARDRGPFSIPGGA